MVAGVGMRDIGLLPQWWRALARLRSRWSISPIVLISALRSSLFQNSERCCRLLRTNLILAVGCNHHRCFDNNTSIWGCLMDRLQEMEVFVAVAEAGSFARAGARMRVSPPAVTRAIASLEERLGG